MAPTARRRGALCATVLLLALVSSAADTQSPSLDDVVQQDFDYLARFADAGAGSGSDAAAAAEAAELPAPVPGGGPTFPNAEQQASLHDLLAQEPLAKTNPSWMLPMPHPMSAYYAHPELLFRQKEVEAASNFAASAGLRGATLNVGGATYGGVPDVQYKDRPVSVPVDVPIPVPVGVPSRPAPFSIFPDHHALSLFANTMPPAPGAAAAGAAQAAALGMSPLLGAYNAQVSPQHPLHPANPLNPARLSDMPPFSLTNPSQHVPDPSATASRVELVPVVLPNGMTMRVPRDMLARTVDAGGAADPVVSDDVARAALAADERLQRLAVAREAWLQRLAAAGSGAPDLLEAGPDLSGVGPDPLAELAGAALPPTSRFSSAQQQVLVQQARVRDAMRRSMSAVGQQDQLAAHLADDIARQQVLLQSAQQRQRMERQRLAEMQRRVAALEVDKRRIAAQFELSKLTTQLERVQAIEENLRNQRMHETAVKEALMARVNSVKAQIRRDSSAIEQLLAGRPDANLERQEQTALQAEQRALELAAKAREQLRQADAAMLNANRQFTAQLTTPVPLADTDAGAASAGAANATAPPAAAAPDAPAAKAAEAA